jgi:hypothetical protein
VNFSQIRRMFGTGGKAAAVKAAKKGSDAKGKGRKTSRRGGRELPLWAVKALRAGGWLLTAFLTVFALYQAFYSYYCRSDSLFVVRDTSEKIKIDTGKTVTPDLVKQFLGISEGVNLFSINVGEKREELLRVAPSIKDISIVRQMPDGLEITIIERDPVVRIGLDGRVADEEGVVFVRYSFTSALPTITRSTGPAKAKPGDRLKGMDLAAVRLAASTFRPECKLRMYEIDSSHDRYLRLTFASGCLAKIAWEGMTEFTRTSERNMIRQYDNLVQCMLLDIGKVHYEWDAQIEGRIYGRRHEHTRTAE